MDILEILFYVGMACLFLGGIIPLLWFLVPGSRSGAQCDRDARLHGQRLASRNKRCAPEICGVDLSNNDIFQVAQDIAECESHMPVTAGSLAKHIKSREKDYEPKEPA